VVPLHSVLVVEPAKNVVPVEGENGPRRQVTSFGTCGKSAFVRHPPPLGHFLVFLPMDASARRRTYDIPKSDSVGLTEWTSKIKALQRQVDEDEEAETRRLEEEIMASRMSRMRRSTLQPRPSSHDPCKSSTECNGHLVIHLASQHHSRQTPKGCITRIRD